MKRTILFGIIIVLVLGIGGKMYMDKQEEKKELLAVQEDLANYIYNNYFLFRENKEKEEKLAREYNNGQGSLTTKEYLEKGKELREYSDVEKIEFTGFSITPMNTVAVHFTINDVYKDDVILDTISAETNKRIYKINAMNEVNSYYLERKKESTKIKMPDDKIIYYEGGVD